MATQTKVINIENSKPKTFKFAFKVIAGVHSAGGKIYKKGEIVLSDIDLSKKWVNKFERVHLDDVEPKQVASAVSVSSKDIGVTMPVAPISKEEAEGTAKQNNALSEIESTLEDGDDDAEESGEVAPAENNNAGYDASLFTKFCTKKYPAAVEAKVRVAFSPSSKLYVLLDKASDAPLTAPLTKEAMINILNSLVATK